MIRKLRNAALCGLAAVIFMMVGDPAAWAQNRQKQLINEIIRKAKAAEEDNGFCAKTGWPNGDNLEVFNNFLKRAKAGTWKVNTFRNGSCAYDVVTKVVAKNGGKCISYTGTNCATGKKCGHYKSTDCLDANGKFIKRYNN